MAQANALTSSCLVCTDPDNSNMVSCSVCLGSYHRTCCKINERDDIFTWICRWCSAFDSVHNLNPTSHQNAIQEQSDSASREQPSEVVPHDAIPQENSTGRTTNLQNAPRSGISRRTQLQLQQLEEEMLLRQEFLRRKYELLYREEDECYEIQENDNEQLQQSAMVNNDQNNCQTPRNPPLAQSCQQNQSTNPATQVNDNSVFSLTAPNDPIHSVNNISLNRVSSSACNTANDNIFIPRRLSAHHTSNVNRMNNRVVVENLAETPTINDISLPQCQSTRIHHNTRSMNQNKGHERDDNMFNCQHNDVNKTNNIENITTTQLMARQSISRDLPLFNGDPKEWPIFFSAFEQSSRIAGYSDEENLVRLQKSLHGKAREAVRNCLMLPDMVPDIIRTLKMYFGRPECILKNVIDEVRKISIQRGKLETLIEFAFAVKNICATIRASQLNDYLNNPTLLQELVDKLPSDTVLQWAMYSKDIARPNLMHFSDWLYTVAEATCRVTVPVFDGSKMQNKREGRLNTHSDSTKGNLPQVCYVCDEQHKVNQCNDFKSLPIDKKWEIIKLKNLCRICLGKHRRRCWFQKPCGVDGCSILHNPLLHNEEEQENTVSGLNSHKTEGESFFRILPVTLHSGLKSINIFALLDDGSTLTLIEQSVADMLGVQGVKDPLCIKWTGDVSRYEDSSQRFSLNISSALPNSKIYPINNVYTVRNMNLSPETMFVRDIKNAYPHLKDVPLQDFSNVIPSMIIGVNNPNLISSLKTIEGDWHQPVATKTRLGWTIFGGGSKIFGRLNFHKCGCEELHGLVKQYFSDESVGINSIGTSILSSEDKRAIEILEDTCKLVDGRYEVGLLWKSDFSKLPNSFDTALKRLKCFQRRSSRDPSLIETLRQQIVNLEEKGYAERLPSSIFEKEEEGKVWYLPTFIVRNPQKPNKIWLVWDAAAKSNNFSLNDFLLKGPDFLRPLMAVLFQFRIGAVAVCGDIAEMFHRIKVRKEDAMAQRFLWWDESNAIVAYQLNVLTFGASCSPCISHFVRDRNARTFAEDSRVVDVITKQHYVDDFIFSTNTVDDAIKLATQVRDVHAKGGFCMRNWTSNSEMVLSALGENAHQENKIFEHGVCETRYEKILGLYWDPKRDVFKMNLGFVRLQRPILCEDIVPTKREVLQVLMSVFDPMGFVACYMSYLKAILQQIWRSGLDLDQPINEETYPKWKNWLTFMPHITSVSIPRCYSLLMQNQCYNIELHTFVDASEDAYAAVSYFRIESGGSVEVKLVAAKSKVAPLRPLSVLRLELQAATIGARLTESIRSHGIKLERVIMWTDSKTVLHWLNGDPRKYKQFVMFRIAEILKFTDATDWRWVPTSLNVADFATKFRPPSNAYSQWFDGPSWLLLEEGEWPSNTDEFNSKPVGTLELRNCCLNLHSIAKSIYINFEYFSSWYRLRRAIANWIFYIQRRQQRLKMCESVTMLSSSHFTKATNFIHMIIQMSCFQDDYTAVKIGKAVKKGGPFDKLNIFMDENGVVKVKNRAQYANTLCGTQSDLVILPGNHYGTKLIISHYHRALHHCNHETVINEMRQKYFIIKLRASYKSIRRNCQLCKNESAKPNSPQMAPLPTARLSAFQRPFSFVGVDYFGPIFVTFGRKSLKRWGVIFTCLTIRAVHIEISHTLSTDSFLMTLRNFIARRGCPIEIYSDNGTNFRGADRFLKEELQKLNLHSVSTETANRGITWKFNPPAAPHMGGAWERLVRSIKTILYKICPSQKFTDESLRSALMEVEMIINSRPLTFVSLDIEDQEAITPNHFLLGNSSGIKPICDPHKIDYKMCLRQSEMLANQFWRRFVKEMIPTLTRRSKWSQGTKPIEVYDIVIIVDENAERNVWLKGKVLEIVKAKDGQVRRAKIKTKNGIVERPAVKLAILDVGNGRNKTT
ncbi:uncharacterized protein LOC142224831 [Haematobia irritans]|uniref:uncharacterized protein LOC142224831 n=1 Tax=Haematobia irritans TaxID=7368 RepID=UPI003F5003AE